MHYNTKREYFKTTEDGKIKFKTTVHADWLDSGDGFPRYGWIRDGNTGLTPQQARDFAEDIIAYANKVEKEQKAKELLPKHWPPKPGDVWRSEHGTDYWVGKGSIMCSGADVDGQYEHYSLKSLVDVVEKYGSTEKYRLVYRKGVKEDKSCES